VHQVLIGSVHETFRFAAIKYGQTLPKIVNIFGLILLIADIAGCDKGGLQRRKLLIRRRRLVHLNMKLRLDVPWGNTKIRKIPPNLLHKAGGMTAYIDG